MKPKFYQVKVQMLGFEALLSVVMAYSKADAELRAVEEFMSINDIERGDTTDEELVRFYAPSVKQQTMVNN